MTREEAIKMLKSKMDGQTDTSYEWAETVRMAIKALEQEPCTVTEFADRCMECGKILGDMIKDAVSREAVVEGLASIAKVKAKSDAQKAMMGRCMYFVENLPSVHPECTEDYCPAAFKPVECEDCISRQAVIEMAYDLSEIDGEHFPEPRMVVDVEDIQNAPPVTPAEKVGRWIDNFGLVYCSGCGETLAGERNYCPNCGRKMQEAEDD